MRFASFVRRRKLTIRTVAGRTSRPSREQKAVNLLKTSMRGVANEHSHAYIINHFFIISCSHSPCAEQSSRLSQPLCRLSVRMAKCSRVCWAICTPSCLLTSLILIALVTAIFILFPSFFMQQLVTLVTILPGHSTYEQLKEPTLPVYKDIYFFNLTNPEAFTKGARPNFTEIGPYSYREIRHKYFNESNFEDNQTLLEYTQLKTFHFSPNTSQNGTSEDDTICTINIPFVAAVAETLQMTGLERPFGILYMNHLLSKHNLYTCVKATPLVFNYTDDLIKELHNNKELKALKKNLPIDYVSIQHNASINDSYPSKIYTGVGNINDLGTFYQWDNLTDLGVWFDDTANMINGTEGLVFRPNLTEGDSLTVFVDDVLRSFPLVYSGKKTFLGLETFRYMLPIDVFVSAFENPNNARWGSWCPSGLIYLGVLQTPSVPVFGSKPRFLDCDPSETRFKMDGIPEPDREKHDTFLYVHPQIGVNIQFQRTLQLNVQVNYTNLFPKLSHIDGTMYFPVMYINEHAELTEDFKMYLLYNGLIAPYIVYGVAGLLVGVALILILMSMIGCYKLIRYRCRCRPNITDEHTRLIINE